MRVRVDVGIHTGRMSFDEAVDYFTAHVSFYPLAAAAAATDPAARAITEGAQRALYRYSQVAHPAFHERLMRMGTIPVGYFRDWFLAS